MAEVGHPEQYGEQPQPKSDAPPEAEHSFNPLTAPKVQHNWVDRGIKLSCEGANHPMHQAYKRGAVPME